MVSPAASHMALAHASPPSSMPESPADLLVVDDDGGMDSSQWPTVSSAAAASEDWDVVDPFLSNDGDEWVEVDDPVRPTRPQSSLHSLHPPCISLHSDAKLLPAQDAEEEDEDVKPSFKDMIQLGDASKGARCAAVAGATQPRFVSAKAAASKECGQQGWQRLPAPESTSLFDFDEDMHELKVHRKRDGHSKNSQKGCRRMAKTKQARALKNSSRR